MDLIAGAAEAVSVVDLAEDSGAAEAAAGPAAVADLVAEEQVMAGKQTLSTAGNAVNAGNIWIGDLISESEKTQISDAIAQEEQRTSGEIVAMIVKRSSVSGHVPLTLTLFIYVLFLVFELPNHVWISEQGYSWIILAAAVATYAASFWLAKLNLIQRIFTPVNDLIFQVERRAILEFQQAGIQATDGKTGILIFISLFERRVVVLADATISAKLPPATWQELCKNLTAKIKQKESAQGIVEAVKNCGSILAEHFPINAGDRNELPNHLIIKQ